MGVTTASVESITVRPATVNLNLYQGDDFNVDLAVKNQDGTPADLTGAVPSAQIRSSPEDPTILATFQATITTNVVHLKLTAAQSKLFSGVAVWDCQLYMPDIITLVRGSVNMKAEVTRP